MVAAVWSLISSLPAPFLADPLVAGPRYFFLPFVALGLLLIFLIGRLRTDRVVAVIAVVALAAALVRVPDAFVRHSEHMDWRAELARCADHPGRRAKVPVQFNGVKADAWAMWIRTGTCRSALGR